MGTEKSGSYEPPQIKKVSPKSEEGRNYLGESFERYKNYLLTTCTNILKSERYPLSLAYQYSEDIVHNMFTSLANSRNAPDMSQPEPVVRAFLLTQLEWAMRKHKNRVRKERRAFTKKSLGDLSDDFLTDAEIQTVYREAKIASNQDQAKSLAEETVRSALATLEKRSPESAKLIKLELEHYYIEDIARLTAQANEKVRQKLAKAHRELREIIRKDRENK